jgi:ribosomal protein S18 acetylase RimI-like enzyme
VAGDRHNRRGTYSWVDADGVTIRNAISDDVIGIARIDERNTGLAKPGYWRDTFERYGDKSGRFCLVAERGGEVLGYIVGEVRAWEFGSPPCGWIFALGVDQDARLAKLGTRLFKAICECFADGGVDKVRTMLNVEDNLNMSFFRSQGMRGGPFIELEMDLDPFRNGGEGRK